MLRIVKLALRIKSNTFDTEIQGLIEACKADMERVGIVYSDTPLCKQAMIHYCRAYFGQWDKSKEQYTQMYNALRDSISLSSEYTKKGGDVVARKHSDPSIRY